MRKKKEQAIITHVAAHDIFGNFRFFKKDNGEIWCAIPDLCKVLDLKNPTMLANRLNENEKAKFNLGYSGKPGNPNIWFANEPGLYRIIFMSKKTEAKKFQDWVYHEVLPSIRKTGSYSLPTKEFITEEEIIDNSLDQTQEPKFSEFHIKDKGKIIATLYFDSRLPDIISIAPEETVIII